MDKIYNGKSNLGGTYVIISKINNNRYYGSTNCFKTRAKQHEYNLAKGNHCNNFLQNSFLKYGTENFIFEVISSLPKDDFLIEEQKLLDLYWDNCINCFNISKFAQNNRIFPNKQPEENKLKHSNRMKKLWQDPIFRENQRLKHLKKEGEIILRKKSQKPNLSSTKIKKGQHLSESTEFKKGNIPWIKDNKNLLPEPWNKNKTKETNDKILAYSKKLIGRKVSEETIGRLRLSHLGKINSNPKCKEWNVWLLSPANEKIFLEKNVSEFCRNNELTKTHLYKVIKGETKCHKNWMLA